MKSLILLLFPLYCSAQVEDAINSLKKYSYQIYGLYALINKPLETNTTGGTCFFFKKNNTLFLITAKHVLVGCVDSSSNSKKADFFPNRMYVALSKDAKDTLIINTSTIRDTAKCPTMFNDPDVIVIPVINSVGKTINSIENLVAPLFQYTDNLLVIGYPGINFIDSDTLKIPDPSVMKWKNGKYDFFGMAIPGTKIADTIHWWLDQKDYPVGKATKGYSGAPFYVQDSITKKWRIAGLLSNSEDNEGTVGGSIAFVKIEYAIDWINHYLKSKALK
jgi:hypothetical protein